jgi:molybdopterin converting factor small subunit
MSLGERLRRLVGRDAAPGIRVHVLVKGRIGTGWTDLDRHVSLPAGSTLRALLDQAERQGIDLRRAIASSPHLQHTLMLNGERCPVDANLDRVLADGDQVYLLAPLAGG